MEAVSSPSTPLRNTSCPLSITMQPALYFTAKVKPARPARLLAVNCFL